ncbi:hypothetical protein RSAG8_09586, partial [Rhizoctonia solani AG-8 WAC10335]
MSLDINWVIIIVVFTALVIEVLTVVAYVFENCWTFDTPRTNTYRDSNAPRGYVSSAYTDVWAANVIGTVEKNHSDTVQRTINPLIPSPGQKPRPPLRTRPANLQSTPDDGPFSRFVAVKSSWMSALVSRTTALEKPKHDAGSLKTRAAPTKTELAAGTNTTHLPAPVIVPYEPEFTEIGVSDTVSGPTGSDFISLGLEDDEEEAGSEGEGDEQTSMDAAAVAAAWIAGF